MAEKGGKKAAETSAGTPGFDHGRPFDWAGASADYARWRDIYPPEFYAKITGLGLCTAGQQVLDLGTGTGVLPRALAGGGARFTGADPSAGQIAEARRLTAAAGLDIRYLVAGAEDCAEPDESCDVVTACQCFWYFDTGRAVPNIHRMLRPGGRLCVLAMNWLPGESPVAAGTEALVLRHNPAWTGGGYRREAVAMPPWAAGLFAPYHLEGWELAVPFTRESWNGRIRACRGVGASLAPAAVAAFEAEHLALLQGFPKAFTVPHYATMLCLQKL